MGPLKSDYNKQMILLYFVTCDDVIEEILIIVLMSYFGILKLIEYEKAFFVILKFLTSQCKICFSFLLYDKLSFW